MQCKSSKKGQVDYIKKIKKMKNYLTKNRCYTNAIKIKPKGLMLHSVGCAQPKAEVFIKQFNNATISKCVHAFIDANTGVVYRTLPWNYKAWHCGGSGNSTHIGIEMCEPPKNGGKEYVDRVYQSAVVLFAELCTKYELDPMKDIISHAEGHKKGIASNHGDPDHLFRKYGYSMDQFRKDVKKIC